jgi:UDP-2,3-diacylglucosamine pyrophosphatase LpxH
MFYVGGVIMNANDIAIFKRLTELYNSTNQNVKELPINSDTKYALFSDLHLGDGGKSDIFAHNKETMVCALEYYKEFEYSIILLGDIEELWQFNFIEIYDEYDNSIYSLLRSFPENKVHRIFGNHDNDWKKPPTDPILCNENIQYGAPEAIKLGSDIFLVHGHQGDKTCDRKTWESRYWARKLKSLVHAGREIGISNRLATKSQIPGNREKLYYEWAIENKVILICGHTHNAIFASRLYYWCLKDQIKKKETEIKKISTSKVRICELHEEIKKHNIDLHIEERMGRHFNRLSTSGKPLPCYFNTGCGHFNDGITNIEIEGDKIRLIKWQRDKSLPLEERRKELWDEKSLSEIRKIINKKSS